MKTPVIGVESRNAQVSEHPRRPGSGREHATATQRTATSSGRPPGPRRDRGTREPGAAPRCAHRGCGGSQDRDRDHRQHQPRAHGGIDAHHARRRAAPATSSSRHARLAREAHEGADRERPQADAHELGGEVVGERQGGQGRRRREATISPPRRRPGASAGRPPARPSRPAPAARQTAAAAFTTSNPSRPSSAASRAAKCSKPNAKLRSMVVDGHQRQRLGGAEVRHVARERMVDEPVDQRRVGPAVVVASSRSSWRSPAAWWGSASAAPATAPAAEHDALRAGGPEARAQRVEPTRRRGSSAAGATTATAPPATTRPRAIGAARPRRAGPRPADRGGR